MENSLDNNNYPDESDKYEIIKEMEMRKLAKQNARSKWKPNKWKTDKWKKGKRGKKTKKRSNGKFRKY